MKPLDPRLLRYARTTRGFLLASVALGAATAGLIIAQATLLAEMIARAFLGGASLADLRTPMLLLLGVVAGRTLVAWLQEVAAHRSSAAVKSQLRGRLLEHALRLGPRWLAGERSGELATLATRGVDALDDYFSRYLPQLVLAVIVPAAVGARILLGDWLSAVTVAATLPLIPIFAILVGLTTRRKMDRQWRTLSVLAAHFLDVVAGLPTLKIFGRAKAQAAKIREVTDRHRRATMSTLRIAFLSALVLELLSSLSVALVAVSIGLRLVEGEMALETALLVLILAPEAYLPLRAVGAQYHASVEGVTAAARIFEVVETPAPAAGTRTDVPDLAHATLRLDRVTVAYEGRDAPALDGFTLTVHPGETVALTGPSGPASRPSSPCSSGSSAPSTGASWPTGTTSPTSTRTPGARRSRGCRSVRTCSRGRSPPTSGSAVRTRPTRRSAPPPRPRTRGSSSRPCRRASTRRSASAVSACPPGSGNASPWPAPSCATRRSSSWTNRPRTWTRRARPPSWTP